MHGYNHTRNIHKINNKWVIRKSIKNKRKENRIILGSTELEDKQKQTEEE